MRTNKIMYLFLGLFVATLLSCSKDDDDTSPTEQCANTDNIYSFTYNGKKYEIIKENKTWVQAAKCAADRGGFLAEINDAAENIEIFNQLMNKASIDNSKTVSADGGSASYVWIGGNDMTTEGTWVWNGNNDSSFTQFWEGDKTGSAVNGLYSNWGNEPDNFGDSGQDALGLALTQWPVNSGTLGTAGHWNDISQTNKLFYVVEYN